MSTSYAPREHWTDTKVDALVGKLLEDEPVAWEKEVLNILGVLREHFHVSATDDSVRIGFSAEPTGGPAVDMLTGQGHDINVSPGTSAGEDEEGEYYTYDIYPDEDWAAKCSEMDKNGEEDWGEIAEDAGNFFEEVMQKFGYEVGSVGGHPPNFTMEKVYEDGKVIVVFAWWGNPYHI